MATINLGSIKFNWKGAYNSGTAYAVDDVVSSGGSSYVCILASTGNATSNGTYWELMAQVGTNGTNGSNGTDGTDLTSILTTQGDILYRDGSGLQRLAKGTASQQLAMNSGANAPEWITASAGGYWSEVTSGTATGNSTINFTNLSTGKIFKLLITGKFQNPTMHISSDNGSSYHTGSSDYKYIGDAWAGNDTATTTYRNGGNSSMFDQAGFFAYASQGGFLEVNIANLSNTTSTIYRAQSAGNTGDQNIGVLGGCKDSGQVNNAFRFVSTYSSTDLNYMLLQGDE